MQTIEPYLSPRFVIYIRDFLLDQQLDPNDFFSASEVSLKNYQELSPVINISHVAELFESVSKRLDKPLFGIDLAEGFHFETSSIIVLAMLSAKNIHGLIQTLVKYDKYVDSAISLDFTIENGECCLSIELLSPKKTSTRQLSLYLVTFIVIALRRTTRTTPKLTKIIFTDEFNTEEIQKKLQLEKTKFEFSGRKNQVFFNREYLKEELYSHNELLQDVLCTTLDKYYAYQNDRYDIIDAVGREILIQSKKSVPSLLSVANQLNMSESTLRRLLSEHKMTFKVLKSNVMMQRAHYYLSQTNLTISEIAYELGYSETSSFSRAFKTSSGKSPDVFRSEQIDIQT
ncbi:MAG: AraC-like DNA-binding protein [Paraglaciecola sp.]|jgi:AraC-like DNA-binding protein